MAATISQRPCVSMSTLPNTSQAEVNFYDTSFFQNATHASRQLPTPASILQSSPNHAAGLIKFDCLNLAVKFGPSTYLRLEEAQTMRAIRQAFPGGEVPVPEVFGWRKHEGQNFIYMSLVRGQTLREAWPDLTQASKESVCDELSGIVSFLQQLTHSLPNTLIGILLGQWSLHLAVR